jgi:hypothetical protein
MFSERRRYEKILGILKEEGVSKSKSLKEREREREREKERDF